MNETLMQWIGSSCGRHGSYTFYKGFKINSNGREKNYCLGEFYFVRNSEDRPICIAELQLIWHDASNDSKLASARLYFKPENTPFGRQSIHGKDELLYADQKVVIKCEDMVQWECSGCSWMPGLIPILETDFIAVKDTCMDKFTGKPEHKYRLKNTLETLDNIPTEKVIILTFQAYCRYNALRKRLLGGMTIAKSEIASLGGIIASLKSTKIMFCRDSFSCPDVDQFHLSGENKAPVLKGRPRKKKIRSSTLAKELKRKRFLADLERVKKNLPSKKMKLSESEEGTESDLSEESTRSYESMDEDKPLYTVETPINKTRPQNGLLPVSIKQVAKVINMNDKELKKTVAPPPLIPTSKVKIEPTSPHPLHKVKIKIESPVVHKIDGGPPPLYPATKSDSYKNTSQTVPKVLPRVDASESTRTQVNTISSPSKAYTVIKSIAIVSTGTSTPLIKPKPDITTSNGIKVVEPLGDALKKTLVDGKPSRLQSSDDMVMVKMEGKENLQESKKTDNVKIKKKRLRQPGNMKEISEDFADEDEKYFMRSLRDFMKSRDTPISKIPALGFKRVNLWTMYNTAQKLGGYDMVTSKRLWRQVYDALGGSTTITSAATYTRRHYERLLLPYESFVKGQVSNKKGLPVQNQPPNTNIGQDNIPKEQPFNNNHSETTNNNNNNNNNAIIRKSKTSLNQNNQSVSSTTRGSSNQSITSTLSNDSVRADQKTLSDLINQSGTTGSQAIIKSDKILINNIKSSRESASSKVVKVKPNGAIPPYSISVQSARKDGVTSSPSVIVTKSINIPASPLVRNSLNVLPSNSSAAVLSSKSNIHVTSNLSQRGTSVTTNVTSRQTAESQASSPSLRTGINATPAGVTYSPSSKNSASVTIRHVQPPQKHLPEPNQYNIAKSPKIHLQQQQYQNNNSKDIVNCHNPSANHVTSTGHNESAGYPVSAGHSMSAGRLVPSGGLVSTSHTVSTGHPVSSGLTVSTRTLSTGQSVSAVHPISTGQPVSTGRTVSTGHTVSSVHPVSTGHPVSAGRLVSTGGPVSTGRPVSTGHTFPTSRFMSTVYPVSTGRPLSTGYPVSTSRPTDQPVSTDHPVSTGHPVASSRPISAGVPVSNGQPVSTGHPVSTSRPSGQPVSATRCTGHPVPTSHPMSAGAPVSNGQPVSTGHPVSTSRPTGHPVSTSRCTGHPVSTAKGDHKVSQRKHSESEKHSCELPHFESIFVQNGLNNEREPQHVEQSNHQSYIPNHQGNARDIHNNPQLFNVVGSSPQQNIRKSSNKRNVQGDQMSNDQSERKVPNQDVSELVSGHSKDALLEPVIKRRKTPSPALIKAHPQPLDVNKVEVVPSRNVCHLAYSQSDTVYSFHHRTPSNDNRHTERFNTRTSFKDGVHVKERRNHHSETMPGKESESSQHRQANIPREIVDLTENVANTSVSYSFSHNRTLKSPSYTKITHPQKRQYLVVDSCQRTEPRLHGNMLANQGKDSNASIGHHEEARQNDSYLHGDAQPSLVNQSKDSHIPRGHQEIPHNSLHSYRIMEDVNLPMTVEHQNKSEKEQIKQLNKDVYRTVTQRTFAESPDEHFQEWRRRQGMTQYPAYITTNQKEQARRSSMTEQPVSLCQHTPPTEQRFLYVQEDNVMHPRVIEEVPLILSSKPGMYYQEDTFYGGVPFYHGGWTTAGVADGVTFKGDPENSNNHFRSSSCIFMPTSQMFGSAVPIAPLSPPVLNQGHVVSGQETVSIHPHCLMTSTYPHNHQMVSQNPTRPLHSFT